MDALAYTEPDWVLLLILAAFIVGLSVLHWILSATLYAGLLGQLLLGAVFGTPLLGLLPQSVEQTTQQLGYIGLLLLIARGGSETRLDVLSQPRNLLLSILVGLTGIALPIGLSFALLTSHAYSYSTLQAFSTGAALSATSLGTVFAVLDALSQSLKSEHSAQTLHAHTKRAEAKPQDSDPASASASHPPRSQGTTHFDEPVPQPDNSFAAGSPPESESASELGTSRIVSILVSAALLDDIIGLVLASVVTSLGSVRGNTTPGSTPSGWPLARPVVASVALILVTVAVCRLAAFTAARSAARRACVPRRRNRARTSRIGIGLEKFLRMRAASISTLLLIGFICAFVAISHVIGSTMLLGAFCAGASATWLHSKLAETCVVVEAEQQNAGQQDSGSLLAELNPERAWSQLNDVTVYILVPFFFSSIGLAIPVRQLFTPAVVWKGWVYACVMAFAKVLPGLWILLAQRLEGSVGKRLKASKRAERAIRCHRRSTEPAEPAMACPAELGAAIDIELSVSPQGPPPPSPAAAAPPAAQSEASLSGATKLSWRPALLLGLCLVSRGEVGFIIINLAREAAILPASDPQGNDAFNIGIWAIVLNTLFGPLAVGFFLKSTVSLRAGAADPATSRAPRKSVAQSILEGPWGAVAPST